MGVDIKPGARVKYYCTSSPLTVLSPPYTTVANGIVSREGHEREEDSLEVRASMNRGTGTVDCAHRGVGRAPMGYRQCLLDKVNITISGLVFQDWLLEWLLTSHTCFLLTGGGQGRHELHGCLINLT